MEGEENKYVIWGVYLWVFGLNMGFTKKIPSLSSLIAWLYPKAQLGWKTTLTGLANEVLEDGRLLPQKQWELSHVNASYTNLNPDVSL